MIAAIVLVIGLLFLGVQLTDPSSNITLASELNLAPDAALTDWAVLDRPLYRHGEVAGVGGVGDGDGAGRLHDLGQRPVVVPVPMGGDDGAQVGAVDQAQQGVQLVGGVDEQGLDASGFLGCGEHLAFPFRSGSDLQQHGAAERANKKAAGVSGGL